MSCNNLNCVPHCLFLRLANFYLYPAEKYHYLSQSGCFSDPTLDDQRDYLNVIVSNTKFAFVTSDLWNWSIFYFSKLSYYYRDLVFLFIFSQPSFNILFLTESGSMGLGIFYDLEGCQFKSHRALGQAFVHNLVSRVPATIGLKQENTKWLTSGESGCPFSKCSRYAMGVFPLNFFKTCVSISECNESDRIVKRADQWCSFSTCKYSTAW